MSGREHQETEQQKELRRQMVQTKIWRRWIREQVKEHFAKPYAEEFRNLKRLLRTLTIEDSDKLVECIKAAEWLSNAPLVTRQIVLRIVATRIMQLRIQNGLPPIDDSMPGFGAEPEPPTAYEQIRDHLKVFGASRE